MAAAAESANRPLPWLGLLHKGVEEVEGSVLKLWTEEVGQCHDDTVGQACRSVMTRRETTFSASSAREKGKEWEGEVGTTAGTLLYTLSNWPRCQVACGAWMTRGGDGLKRSATLCPEGLNGSRKQ
jgi:hypothetical protein